jgi:hypothetical protein
MPAFGIVSPDPNDTTQLIAYAIPRDQGRRCLSNSCALSVAT